jgi:uncharacterized protein
MARYYSVAQLSNRLSETPEGFLICLGVAIARAGDLSYLPTETPITPGSGPTLIRRTIADLHNPETMASFEGKPVTLDHPTGQVFVTPDNWTRLAVGIVQNVRPGIGDDADKLLADLLITDRVAIDAVKSGLREVSCGYEADYVEESPGYGRQQGILGNHVALVAAGRCGSECAIVDAQPKEIIMTLKDKVLAAIGITLDSALSAETQDKKGKKDESEMTEDEKKKVLEEKTAKDAKEKKDKEEKEAADAKAKDEKKMKDGDDPIMARIEALEAAIEKLMGQVHGEDKKAGVIVGDAVTDQETIARAEILAPGIQNGGQLKQRAIDAALKTVEGKAVLDVLLAGKACDAANVDVVFIAASEMLKGVRRSAMAGTRVIDNFPSLKPGEITPEMINEANAKRYATEK